MLSESHIPTDTVVEQSVRLTPQSRVVLLPLAIHSDDGQYIVGRPTTGLFIALPEEGRRILDLLQQGLSLEEIQQAFQAEGDVEVAIEDFVQSLIELGFVQAVDERILADQVELDTSSVRAEPSSARWLLSWPVALLYGLLILVAGVTVANRPELFPDYQDFFWTTTTSVLIVINTILTLACTALHELGHMLTARAQGVSAKISLSTRLHHLVVQADVTDLWMVPRHQRYIVYLAGIMVNLALIAIAFLALAYAVLPPIIQGLLRVIVLANFLQIIWQFYFYMRTDLYFVVLDLLRCYNLFDDAWAYLRYRAKQCSRLLVRSTTRSAPSDPLSHLSPREQRYIRLYAWFMLVGSGISLSTFGFYGVPILATLFFQAAAATWQGLLLGNLWQFLDGFATLCVEGGFQLAFLVTFVRKHWHRWASWHGLKKIQG